MCVEPTDEQTKAEVDRIIADLEAQQADMDRMVDEALRFPIGWVVVAAVAIFLFVVFAVGR